MIAARALIAAACITLAGCSLSIVPDPTVPLAMGAAYVRVTSGEGGAGGAVAAGSADLCVVTEIGMDDSGACVRAGSAEIGCQYVSSGCASKEPDQDARQESEVVP